MRRLHSALAATVLVLTAAGCGQQPEGDIGFGGAPDPDVDLPARPNPKPVEQRTPVQGPDINAEGLPDGYPTEVWTQSNGRVVVATGQEGGCSHVHAEVADQTAQRVTIRLVEETPEPPAYCTMDLRYPPVAVSLEDPLGDRMVVLQEHSVQVPNQQ